MQFARFATVLLPFFFFFMFTHSWYALHNETHSSETCQAVGSDDGDDDAWSDA
jgi:hypothetical protein